MNGEELAEIILKEEGIGRNRYEIREGRSRVIYNKKHSRIYLKKEVLEGIQLENLLIAAHEVGHLLNNDTNSKKYQFFKTIKYMYGILLFIAGLNLVLCFFGLFSLYITILLSILLLIITTMMVVLYKRDEREANRRAFCYVIKYSENKNELATLINIREADLISNVRLVGFFGIVLVLANLMMVGVERII